MNEPRIVITDNSITISYVVDNLLAIAELSKLTPSLAQEFLKEASKAPAYKKLTQEVKEVTKKTNEIYFFNRLNVPKRIQSQGLGSLLLQKLETVMKEKSGLIINTASAYGDLSQNDLIAFYQKHNFHLLHKDGLMVYHPSLIIGEAKPTQTLKNKM